MSENNEQKPEQYEVPGISNLLQFITLVMIVGGLITGYVVAGESTLIMGGIVFAGFVCNGLLIAGLAALISYTGEIAFYARQRGQS
ncbi:MAG: hypothetical protein LBV44_00660 [Methylobacillus sp.]|jgi:hypothetical protein|nr:hypothetical protein [Methylobacillus sp.]